MLNHHFFFDTTIWRYGPFFSILWLIWSLSLSRLLLSLPAWLSSALLRIGPVMSVWREVLSNQNTLELKLTNQNSCRPGSGFSALITREYWRWDTDSDPGSVSPAPWPRPVHSGNVDHWHYCRVSSLSHQMMPVFWGTVGPVIQGEIWLHICDDREDCAARNPMRVSTEMCLI